MEVKVDDNYRITLPEEVCDESNIEVGQRFKIVISDKKITLVPIYPAHELRGIFKGMSRDDYREDEDRI